MKYACYNNTIICYQYFVFFSSMFLSPAIASKAACRANGLQPVNKMRYVLSAIKDTSQWVSYLVQEANRSRKFSNKDSEK